MNVQSSYLPLPWHRPNQANSPAGALSSPSPRQSGHRSETSGPPKMFGGADKAVIQRAGAHPQLQQHGRSLDGIPSDLDKPLHRIAAATANGVLCAWSIGKPEPITRKQMHEVCAARGQCHGPAASGTRFLHQSVDSPNRRRLAPTLARGGSLRASRRRRLGQMRVTSIIMARLLRRDWRSSVHLSFLPIIIDCSPLLRYPGVQSERRGIQEKGIPRSLMKLTPQRLVRRNDRP
jgi:hypothetical protein